MTQRIDITQEYKDLINALLALGSGQDQPYLEAGWYDPVHNNDEQTWAGALLAYQNLQRRVYVEDTRDIPWAYLQEIHLRFGLDPVQQEVFLKPDISMSTNLPDFIIQAGRAPALKYKRSFIVSGEYRLPASLKFRLDVECESYLFSLNMKNLKGPIFRRYLRIERQYEQWLEGENPEGDNLFQEGTHFDFTEDKMDLLPESLLEATLCFGS